MNKRNQRISYTLSGYRYAPESFRSYKVIVDLSGRGNHRYILLKFTPTQEREIGYTCITKGKEAAYALAKRYDRARRKKPGKYVTYGFFDANQPVIYHFTRELYCRADAALAERLNAYKAFKDYLLSRDCKIEQYTQCKLDGHYQPEQIEKVYSTVDITKPVMVYLTHGSLKGEIAA